MGGKPLGYNIKYIERPGYKTKKPLYEIKPGVWVSRTKIPETKAYREMTKAHKNDGNDTIFPYLHDIDGR